MTKTNAFEQIVVNGSDNTKCIYSYELQNPTGFKTFDGFNPGP